MTRFAVALLVPLASTSAWADAEAVCKDLYSQAAIDPIRAQLPFTAPPTFEQLTDTSKPTEQQKRAIAALDKARAACLQANMKEWQDWPAELLSATDRAAAREQLARVDLYNGKITFGEYNATAQRIGADLGKEVDEVQGRIESSIAAKPGQPSVVESYRRQRGLNCSTQRNALGTTTNCR